MNPLEPILSIAIDELEGRKRELESVKARARARGFWLGLVLGAVGGAGGLLLWGLYGL